MKLIKFIIYLITIYFVLIYSFFNYYEKYYDYVVGNDIVFGKLEVLEKFDNYDLINVSAYTPFCEGCTGVTASGYDVLDNVYYNDKEYGYINVLAGDNSISFGSVIYFFDLNLYGVVLDRGSMIGFDKDIGFDLLMNDYNAAINFGIKYNMKYKIIRYGF